jgi:hypothetical protein
VASLVYDAGALIAADRGTNAKFIATHARAVERDIPRLVPAGVLAQAWRDGARQAQLSRFLKACEIVELTEQRAREIGVLCAGAGHHDVIDASVVLLAAETGGVIFTSDRPHITKFIDALEPAVHHPAIYDV